MKSVGFRYVQSLVKLALLFGLVVSFLLACQNNTIEYEEENSAKVAVWKLNKNVTGLKILADACMTLDSIAVFNIQYNGDGSVLYMLDMKEAGDIELFSEVISDEIRVPELSMELVDGIFFWTVNGAPLIESEGERISVTDSTKPISFLLQDGVVYCLVKNTVVGIYPSTKTGGYLAKDIAFEYDFDNSVFNIRLSSGYRTTMPTVSVFSFLNELVPNKSYYKDVFLDAGIALTSRKSLSAAEYLCLSLEGISFSSDNPSSKESHLQNAIVSGDSNDSNGRLLYPDGQPRYKLLFVNGGLSYDHGESLGERGLQAMRAFVKNGGSYVGTCAGAFFASNGYNGKKDYRYYLSVWPGMMRYTNLERSYTGMLLEKGSPLLQYHGFDGDFYVDSIWHNKGGYPESFPSGTEILARYDYPKKTAIHNKPSIWAYKESHQSGRIVLTGSHPEVESHGEKRDLMAAMMRYALDGVGSVSIKGFLKNGEERHMDKKTEDRDPAFTRIGDLQTHHFATFIPSDAKNVRVVVDSSSDCDLSLMMCQDTYAFTDNAQYCSNVPGPRQNLSFSTIREGIWYVSVQCLTTVTVEETDYGQKYVGSKEVLNGIPYRISISWE